MKTKHIFVSALDVGELLPFTVRKSKTLALDIKEQERARLELVKFIDLLSREYHEEIFYMGMDIIEAKTYERFIFAKNGFFEIMTESPLAMSAHFVDKRNADRFCAALKKTLAKLLKKDAMSQMFIDSIEVSEEEDESLTYQKWDRMKGIKGM